MRPSAKSPPRLAEMFDTQDSGSPSMTCAPSNPNSSAPSNATMTDHTLLSKSLFSRSMSARGLTPKPHRSAFVTLSHAPRPSRPFAVDASLCAHLPLCAMTTKSYSPNRFARSLAFVANVHAVARPSSSKRDGDIAPTHCGRRTSSAFDSSASDIARNPPTPTYRATSSSNARNSPSRNAPTAPADHSASAPHSTSGLANDSRATSLASVKYCNP